MPFSQPNSWSCAPASRSNPDARPSAQTKRWAPVGIFTQLWIASKHRLILTVTSQWYLGLDWNCLNAVCSCVTRPLKVPTGQQFLLDRLLYRATPHRVNHRRCRYETGMFPWPGAKKNTRQVSSGAFLSISNTLISLLLRFREKGECNFTGKCPSYPSVGKP